MTISEDDKDFAAMIFRHRDVPDEEFQITPETVTSDNAAEKIERRMNDLSDLFAGFPDEGRKVDPRAWNHLLIYAPKPPLPEEIAGLLALQEGLPDGPWSSEVDGLHDDIVTDAKGSLVAKACGRYSLETILKIARAIAALPSLFAALERAYSRPLPEEIAGLVERLKHKVGISLQDEAAAALERMARENERLRGFEQDARQEYRDRVNSLNGRIRELEDLLNRQKARTEEEAELRGNALNDLDQVKAERDKLAADASRKCQLVLEEAKRADAIRAKTIEECVSIADNMPINATIAETATAIRALNQPEAGEGGE